MEGSTASFNVDSAKPLSSCEDKQQIDTNDIAYTKRVFRN